MALAELREGAAAPAGSTCVSRSADVQGVRRARRAARRATSIARCRARGVNPGYPLGRDYEGMDDVLLVAVTEKRTPADIERLAEVLASDDS